jgi:hypothetical protein
MQVPVLGFHIRSRHGGIQAGTHPYSSDFVIGPKTVKAVSDVAAQIVLTVYAPEQIRKQTRSPAAGSGFRK